jgi:hypothetical protein
MLETLLNFFSWNRFLVFLFLKVLMMVNGNWLLRVCVVLNVVLLELAIMTDAHSFITPNLINTFRLLEITIKHFIFLQNIFVQKLILISIHLYGILG